MFLPFHVSRGARTGHRNAGWLDSVTALKRAPTVFFPMVVTLSSIPALSSVPEDVVRHLFQNHFRLLAEGSVMWANNFQQIEAFNTCMCFFRVSWNCPNVKVIITF